MVSYDVIGKKMAGPGIRYYHLARSLSRFFETTLAVPQSSSDAWDPSGLPSDIQTVCYQLDQWHTIEPYIQQCDVCIVPGDWVGMFPQLGETSAHIVIDGYTPLPAEMLTMAMKFPEAQQYDFWKFYCLRHLPQYAVGDFYICASERQRDWWLGQLDAHGRLNPETYRSDPSLRNLIDVVPYGLAESVPVHTQAIIKGVWPGIHESDRLALWGGGLWSWLDPLTAVRAVAKLWYQDQPVKLIFPGTKHPNPALAATPTQEAAVRELATQLGILEKAVFFGDWIAYEMWDNVLLECDIALSLHYDTLETRLAFRSRVLEYIRAGLPIVATEGDSISQLVMHYGIGQSVGYQDVEQVATAIAHQLELPKEQLKTNFAQAQADLTWGRAVQPLVRFCQNPYHAADRVIYGSRLGHPAYVDLKSRLVQFQQLVDGYERGLFIRTMRKLHQIRQTLWT